jgi:methylmalonyl-CoA/ethylmalonyl-CoA epimerase
MIVNRLTIGMLTITLFSLSPRDPVLAQDAKPRSPNLTSNPPGSLQGIRPHNTLISVPNLEESVAWYQEKLGARYVLYRDLKPVNAKAATLDLNGFIIQLFQLPDGKRVTPVAQNLREHLLPHGFAQIGFQVSDIRATFNELKAKDVEIVTEPEWNEQLKFWWFFIKDNNGNFIEFVQLVD